MLLNCVSKTCAIMQTCKFRGNISFQKGKHFGGQGSGSRVCMSAQKGSITECRCSTLLITFFPHQQDAKRFFRSLEVRGNVSYNWTMQKHRSEGGE